MNHSPEPWSVITKDGYFKNDIKDADGHYVISNNYVGVSGGNYDAHADAQRIIACVNSSRGVPAEHLEYVIDRGLADISDDAARLDWVREARRKREVNNRPEN